MTSRGRRRLMMFACGRMTDEEEPRSARAIATAGRMHAITESAGWRRES
jgi:hypothetical protein